MSQFNYSEFYRETLKKCFPEADIQINDVDSITKGLSLLVDGDTVFHIAYGDTSGHRVKITQWKLSGYDCVHVNVLFEGNLPCFVEYEPNHEFLEEIIQNRKGNNTKYYRLQI